MNYVERRSIEELAALYQFEPSIRDVIVEGSDDAALIEWYLKNRCTNVFSIIEINAIDVPAQLFKIFNLADGNRGRIIALANYLDETLNGKSRDCVTLVIDSDYDRIVGKSWRFEFLLTTDFTCFEMYLFSDGILDKLMSVVLGGATISAANALRTTASVLQRLWVYKVANHLLGLSMSWLSFTKNCKIVGDSIEFNDEDFIIRYLIANGKKRDKQKFRAKCEELTGKLAEDPRHGIDGHHLMELLRWYLRKHVRDTKPLKDLRAFERAYYGCLELSMLDQYTLFKTIASRICVTERATTAVR